jgi:hypothetical protein
MRHARHIRLIVAVSSIMTDGLMPFKSRSEAIVPVRLSEEAVVRVLMGYTRSPAWQRVTRLTGRRKGDSFTQG